ncbi:beta-1,3-galactosyltransferase brn-like [Ostrea edulis]|uniref:beta-1,3-galactosyltransferase brn-like n=1 Tax=Ostrea edulis TaxID=37623 RepID=UPI002096580B|nr:beta-1,3-galactosyltransferase brn-like [Ostrea edulis]XP_055998147.1 beta-1,3-galactosyltransferase brn-like [Ostrea edulis]XP_055998149.1 beta-1,3-galactosyltransferase brn-like [Ostrea edulis]XP_055998150.1 beta-1,3-galactosyltransferase brn-like [Ostrea edulis]XP_055998151.1 beta-1,3-galactosyltransferase brn-like [Ostrea edulis]
MLSKLACVRQIRKCVRHNGIFVSFLFLFFLVAFTTLGTTLVHQHTYYRRPVGGILQDIFPNEEIIQFRFFSYDTEYRYPPIKVDFPQKIKNGTIDLPIVNRHPFKFIFNADHVCKGTKQKSLLIVVKSYVGHFALRNVLRKTWIPKAKAYNIPVVFALGYKKDLQSLVIEENARHNDIVQEDFLDVYLNNTYKAIMTFNWVVENCNHFRYVYFDDDDMFLHLDNLVKHVKMLEMEGTNLFSGSLASRGKPVRDPHSKWYISWEEYPFDFWPPYVGGSSMIASMDIVKDMQKIFPYVRPLSFDDVYLGIVLNKLGILPNNNTHFDNTILRHFGRLHELIANHGFDDPVLYSQTYQLVFPDEKQISHKEKL